ncbi:nucleotidyltransferase domain-containing protein [Luteimicrobium album]|nr:nucleotidyltransferase domain-containing protein [Luteimicrobium album]
MARAGLPLTGLQVASLAGASPERTRQVLRRLTDDGLVVKREAGAAFVYSANADHILWPAVRTLVDTCDSTVLLLKQEAVRACGEHATSSTLDRLTLALFGSVARGTPRSDSDIDILLIVPDDISPELTETLVATLIETLGVASGNEANVLALTRARFDEMVRHHDPLVETLATDAQVFNGPDFRRRLTGASWDDE